jgi:hypothetical protein
MLDRLDGPIAPTYHLHNPNSSAKRAYDPIEGAKAVDLVHA